MRETIKIIAWGIVVAMVAVVVFVRPSELGSESGGSQASKIINATTSGFASIVQAATGVTPS